MIKSKTMKQFMREVESSPVQINDIPATAVGISYEGKFVGFEFNEDDESLLLNINMDFPEQSLRFKKDHWVLTNKRTSDVFIITFFEKKKYQQEDYVVTFSVYDYETEMENIIFECLISAKTYRKAIKKAEKISPTLINPEPETGMAIHKKSEITITAELLSHKIKQLRKNYRNPNQ